MLLIEVFAIWLETVYAAVPDIFNRFWMPISMFIARSKVFLAVHFSFNSSLCNSQSCLLTIDKSRIMDSAWLPRSLFMESSRRHLQSFYIGSILSWFRVKNTKRSNVNSLCFVKTLSKLSQRSFAEIWTICTVGFWDAKIRQQSVPRLRYVSDTALLSQNFHGLSPHMIPAASIFLAFIEPSFCELFITYSAISLTLNRTVAYIFFIDWFRG